MECERFREVEHTADVAIRVWGDTLVELFANAAYGMASQLTDPQDVDLQVEERMDLQADDVERLLVDWLSELLYLGERHGVVFVDFDLSRVTPHDLRGVARGGPVDTYDSHIKAVTFSELDVQRLNDRYETTVVFDV